MQWSEHHVKCIQALAKNDNQEALNQYNLAIQEAMKLPEPERMNTISALSPILNLIKVPSAVSSNQAPQMSSAEPDAPKWEEVYKESLACDRDGNHDTAYNKLQSVFNSLSRQMPRDEEKIAHVCERLGDIAWKLQLLDEAETYYAQAIVSRKKFPGANINLCRLNYLLANVCAQQEKWSVFYKNAETAEEIHQGLNATERDTLTERQGVIEILKRVPPPKYKALDAVLEPNRPTPQTQSEEIGPPNDDVHPMVLLENQLRATLDLIKAGDDSEASKSPLYVTACAIYGLEHARELTSKAKDLLSEIDSAESDDSVIDSFSNYARNKESFEKVLSMLHDAEHIYKDEIVSLIDNPGPCASEIKEWISSFVTCLSLLGSREEGERYKAICSELESADPPDLSSLKSLLDGKAREDNSAKPLTGRVSRS